MNLVDRGRKSFSQKESCCSATFTHNAPFWHLCTPGQYTEILCETEDDYEFFVTLIAIASYYAKVTIVAFEVMSNHIHIVLAGEESRCRCCFDYFREKVKRYYRSIGRYVDLNRFTCQLIPLESLESVRNEIVYNHRNGYLVHDSYTPYSYPWSTGSLYFNELAYKDNALPFSKVPFREKQQMCHGRVPPLPDRYMVKDGMILPQSFCAVSLGESLFRDAHQYFTMLSKNYEAYSEVARRLGDAVVLDDEEMYSVVRILCKDKYDGLKPSTLSSRQKLDVAKWMKQQYNASDGQIQRILRLDRSLVSELFGH